MTAIAFILRSKTLHRQKQILEELVIVSLLQAAEWKLLAGA